MESWSSLPTKSLSPTGLVSEAFRKRGCSSYRDAAQLVQGLPYGRISDRTRYELVLDEERGTCSTKHALITALGRELSIEIELVMACFEMSESNTPGVGLVLRAHEIDCILEAHTFVRFGGAQIDLTWPTPPSNNEVLYMYDRSIEPSDIGARKTRYHQDMLETWWKENQLKLHGLSTESLWTIREECIAALQR